MRLTARFDYAQQELADMKTDVLQEELARLLPPGDYAIWSPYDAYEAADIMQIL